MAHTKQQGFTLIELVMVIVILGILAATALPKFANLGNQARIASLNGLSGAINSAVGITKSAFLATGTSTSPVTLSDGSTVAVSTTTGIPTAAGIVNAIDVTGFNNATSGTTTTFTIKDYTVPSGKKCEVAYDGTAGTTSILSDGC